ncbi:MAG: hypothetical protein ACKVKO_12950, partial [Acidimicrobiales bacterium]
MNLCRKSSAWRSVLTIGLMAVMVASLVVTSTTTSEAAGGSLDNINVMVIGSSECGGLVRYGQLATKLEAVGRFPTVACSGARQASWGTFAVELLPQVPSTVVVTMGLNGGLDDANIGALVVALRNQGAQRIIWYTVNSRDNNYGANNQALVSAGARLGIEVVRWDQIGTREFSDNVHYTTPGYQIFADHIVATATGTPAPAVAGKGPCVLVSKGLTTQWVGNYLGVSAAEIAAANPWWDLSWQYGGVGCKAFPLVADSTVGGFRFAEANLEALEAGPGGVRIHGWA